MWRYYYNKRDTTDDYKKMTISFFKKHGYLKDGLSYASWSLNWIRNDMPNGSISFSVSRDDERGTGHIRVFFTQTDRATQEKKEYDYKISIISTPCYFGWRRWWFLDPCKETPLRCSILYLQDNGAFASRKTLNLAYESQNESRFGRRLSFLMGMNATKAIVLQRTMKYPYRNGKETKKMKRFLKLSYNNPSHEEIMSIENLFSRWKTRKR